MKEIIKILQDNINRSGKKILDLLNESQINLLKHNFNHQDPLACLFALKQELLGRKISLKCPICNKELQKTQWERLTRYNFKRSCTDKSCRNQFRKDLFKEKYGVEHNQQLPEIQEKTKRTNLERYGVEHPAQSEEVLNKMKNTCLERYGVENFALSPLHKEKADKTCLERYGVEYSKVQTLPEIKDKVKLTNLERYGVETPLEQDEIKDKVKLTNLERYGVEWHTQQDNFKDKAKITNLERYGVENFVQSSLYKEKMILMNQELYGVDWYVQSDDFREKYYNTCLELYGVTNPMKVKQIAEKVKQTIIKKYGVFPVPSEIYTNFSKIELEVLQFIETSTQNFIIKNDRKILGGFEIDIYIPDLKLGIEVNGDYLHSDVYKQQNYHLRKTELAESKGIRLIHIWEHEWKNNQDYVKYILGCYLNNQIPDHQDKLSRDYFSALDFPEYKIEKPIEETLDDLKIYKTGYLIK